MNQSLTNRIVANIKQTSLTNTNFIKTENVICIDTSKNRIGINTRNPQYSIDISNTSDFSSNIRVDSIYLQNAYANNIETSNINVNVLDVSSIDVSFINIIEGSFNYLDGNDICVNNIKIFNNLDISKVNIHTICGDVLDINDTILAKNIRIIGTPQSPGILELSFVDFDLEQDVTVNSLISNTNIICSDINNTNKITTSELSSNLCFVNDFCCNILTVFDFANFNSANFTSFVGFQDINVKDASFDNLKVLQNTEIVGNLDVCGQTVLQTLSSENIQVNNLVNLSGESIINNGNFVTPIANFTDANINNLIVDTNLISKDLTDCSNGKLLIPSKNTYQIKNSLMIDNSNNYLTIYNDISNSIIKNNIILQDRCAFIRLNNEISGNDLSYNQIENKWFIDNSKNLILSEFHNNSNIIIDNNSNIKYIPIKIINNFPSIESLQKYSISNNRYLNILNYNASNVFEVNLNCTIQYINKNPGDVEVNNYNINIHSGKTQDLSFCNINNSIIVFDNSYNYSNSSLNYIGHLDSSINFFISSNKEIDFLRIDRFYCTIKQLY